MPCSHQIREQVRDEYRTVSAVLQFFPRAEQERLKREYHSIRQRASENSTEYMQRFLRLAGFLGQAGYVAQVADAARNLEILRDRGDDYDRSERSDRGIKVGQNKRHKSVETGISRTLSRIIMEFNDQKNDRLRGLTGRAVVMSAIPQITVLDSQKSQGTPSEGLFSPCWHLQRESCKKKMGAGSSGHAKRSQIASACRCRFALSQDRAAIYLGAQSMAIAFLMDSARIYPCVWDLPLQFC
ncbi:hypothetical protein Tco_0360533 [Tanacetum coccineum]|uniref:Retrotransposon gag domain-containing protein n=1 Tax=Tanacetum coccineum TaxID=301880 RepID=A0ABQ4Y111_9ASTR